jgi:hypothetical protein
MCNFELTVRDALTELGNVEMNVPIFELRFGFTLRLNYGILG